MKKLFIINQAQFGYHIDTYYYCKYLKYDFKIVYICWDHDLPKIEMEGVRVVYACRKGSIPVRTLRFLRTALSEIDKSPAMPIAFIKYFKVVSLTLRFFRPKTHFVLDIRTGSVHKSELKRRFQDTRLKFETRFFRHVTVISQSLAKKLGIAHKAHILPLGADVLSGTDKTFENLNLLYVGTLFNRNIELTIYGFKKFYDELGHRIPCSYTIIGDGLKNEARELKKLASELGLAAVVKVLGRIPHTELKPYFDACNVGISYVPMTDYYDCQPVTKTFEYLLSGMPVIATATSENKIVIEPENGVIVVETVDDFHAGLKLILERLHLFNSASIRQKARKYTWETIVKHNLKPFLEKKFRNSIYT